MRQPAPVTKRFLILVALSLIALALPASTFAMVVHGTVRSAATFKPIGGVQISVVILGFSPVPTVGGTVSQADGTYSMDVGAGGNTVFTYAAGYADGFFPFQPVKKEQDFLLTPVAAITGTLYDPSRQPVDFSYVNLLNAADGTIVSGSQTYNGGKFAFNGIAAGTYLVCMFTPYDDYRDACYDHWNAGPDDVPNGTPVTVVSGKLVQNIDIHLQTGAAIDGTITDRATHAPLYTGYLEITLYSPQGSLLSDFVKNTDETGAYHIGGLAPGDYYVTIWQPFVSGQGYYPQVYGGPDCDPNILDLFDYLPTCSFAGVTPLRVPAQGLANIDFDLSSGGVVTGRVVDAATDLGIPDAIVNGCTPPNYYATATTTTDGSGNYRLTHLLEHFTVVTRAPSYMDQMWPGTLYDDGDHCGSDDPQANFTLSTPTQTIAGINFFLSQGSHVSGVVSGTQGVAAHVAVFLRSFYPPTLVEDVTTNVNGTFVITDLTTSPYYYYYTAIAYLDDGVTCVMYGGGPCGPNWKASDPTTADVENGGVFDAGLGTVILDLNFQLTPDAVFHDGFE